MMFLGQKVWTIFFFKISVFIFILFIYFLMNLFIYLFIFGCIESLLLYAGFL